MEYLQRAAVAAKAAAKQAKYQMAGLTEIEIKTLECTNSDPWGAHGKDLAELARATRNREDMYLIMKTLWHRLDGRDDQWRHVYKALTVMEFLVAQGAEDVTRELRDSLRTIERLKDFHYKEPNGKDQGINVREKSKNLVKVRAIGADPVPGPRLAARASPRSLERVAPPRPTLTDPLPVSPRSPTSPAPQRSQQDRADARQGHRQQGQVRRHLRRRLPLRKRPRARHARTIPLGRRLAAVLGVSRIQGRLLGPGKRRRIRRPRCARARAAPVPASAEMQPSFANFDDADDGDFEDDTASRRPGGFVPKIQMSAPTSPAPAGPTAALAPPPGADGPARGNLFAAPVVTPAMGGGSTMDDLFGGMTTAAAASTATDPFGDFAATSGGLPRWPRRPCLICLDWTIPRPRPRARSGTALSAAAGWVPGWVRCQD